MFHVRSSLGESVSHRLIRAPWTRLLCFKNFRVHCRFIAGEYPGCNFLVLHLKIGSQSETMSLLSFTGCLGDGRSSLTLTVHSPTKSNKGKWRKCAKSDYVIEAGLIWERNRCPGSDTRVACHGWTVHCGAGGPRFETQGEPPFLTLPFRGDRLETKKGARELALKPVIEAMSLHTFMYCHLQARLYRSNP